MKSSTINNINKINNINNINIRLEYIKYLIGIENNVDNDILYDINHVMIKLGNITHPIKSDYLSFIFNGKNKNEYNSSNYFIKFILHPLKNQNKHNEMNTIKFLISHDQISEFIIPAVTFKVTAESFLIFINNINYNHNLDKLDEFNEINEQNKSCVLNESNTLNTLNTVSALNILNTSNQLHNLNNMPNKSIDKLNASYKLIDVSNNNYDGKFIDNNFLNEKIKFINNYKRREYENYVSVIISEHYCNLLEFLYLNYKKLKLIHWKILFFQIISALVIIQNKFPFFRHNNLTAENILIYKIDDNEINFEYSILGKKFLLPHIGFTIKLCNFDSALIPKIIENPNIAEVFRTTNYRYDIDYFFGTLICTNLFFKHKYYPFIPNGVRNFVEHILAHRHTTLFNILNDPFFEEFTEKKLIIPKKMKYINLPSNNIQTYNNKKPTIIAILSFTLAMTIYFTFPCINPF